jgi:hypothetical protein
MEFQLTEIHCLRGCKACGNDRRIPWERTDEKWDLFYGKFNWDNWDRYGIFVWDFHENAS